MVRKFAKNDEGVSAVIGVILMVAITVILAAVIAAFVFSMSNNISKPYTVGINIKKTPSGAVLITNSGGPDVGQLSKINITYQPAGRNVMYAADNGNNVAAMAPTAFDAFNVLTTTGGSYTIPMAGYLNGSIAEPPTTPTHIIVVGYFKDGKSQVIGETDV